MHARPDPLVTRSRSAPRSLLALGICLCVVAVAAGGCGRRGKLEPPTGSTRESGASPASSRALPLGTGVVSGAAAPDPDAVRDGDELSNVATPIGGDSTSVQTTRGSKRGYKIPKDPFILDAIL